MSDPDDMALHAEEYAPSGNGPTHNVLDVASKPNNKPITATPPATAQDKTGEATREGAARQQRRRETGSWDEPDVSILDDRRGELPGLPLDAFPAVMHGWIRSAARGAGVR